MSSSLQSSRRTARRNIQATIDMTPLMDLTFMLLIIFVITVPSMYYKSDVKLEPPKSTTSQKMEVDQKSLFVELDAAGGLWIGEGNSRRSRNFATVEALGNELTVLKQSRPDLNIYLVGDKERQYKEVVALANVIQKAGFSKLSLVFNPER